MEQSFAMTANINKFSLNNDIVTAILFNLVNLPIFYNNCKKYVYCKNKLLKKLMSGATSHSLPRQHNDSVGGLAYLPNTSPGKRSDIYSQ